MVSLPEPPLAFVHHRTHRLIASRYPTIGVFDELVSAEDAAAAMEIELLTNGRLRAAGRLPPSMLVHGAQGATMINAAFAYTDVRGGRFHGPELGCWYAAFAVQTAIRETVHHHTRRLALSEAGFRQTIQMRELLTTPRARLHDIRGRADELAPIYDRDDYTASQAFGRALRQAGSKGIVYDSVRHEGGTCLAVFDPWLLPPVIQGDQYQYSWTGAPEPQVVKLAGTG
jgi:RES domain-containing protein